jgi:hypothetical protein
VTKLTAPKARLVEQVPTIKTTTAMIMSAPEFKRGFDEVRGGVPFDWRVGSEYDDDTSWHYERGRLFGHIAPLNMPLRIGGRLNPKAVALCDAAFNRQLII